MTHSELIQRSARWLRNKKRCNSIILDKGFYEKPDAIGWKHNFSILVECKISRSDFLKDKKKMWRQHPGIGLGMYRYYLAPKGLLNVEDMPEKWGLLEVCGKVIKIRKEAERIEQNETGLRFEIQFLSSYLNPEYVKKYVARNNLDVGQA